MPSDGEILFQGFSEAQRKGFLDLAIPETYAVQDVIVKVGDRGSDMLIVETGVVSVWVREIKVNEVRSDSVLGISTIIEPHPRTTTLIAETPVRVRLFERSKMLAYLESLPSKLFHQFFINAFHIHIKLIQRCEERVVQLAQELKTL